MTTVCTWYASLWLCVCVWQNTHTHKNKSSLELVLGQGLNSAEHVNRASGPGILLQVFTPQIPINWKTIRVEEFLSLPYIALDPPYLQPDTRAFKPCSFSWDGQFNYISCKMTVTPVSQMSSLRMSLKEVPTTITPKYLGRARNTWPLSLIGKVGSEKERLRDHAPHSRSTISLCTSAPCPLHDASQQWLTGQGTLHFQILKFRSGLQGFIDIELKLDWRFFQTNEGD